VSRRANHAPECYAFAAGPCVAFKSFSDGNAALISSLLFVRSPCDLPVAMSRSFSLERLDLKAALPPENLLGDWYIGKNSKLVAPAGFFVKSIPSGNLSLRTLMRLQSYPCGAVQILPGTMLSGKQQNWWPRQDLNLRPTGYEPAALTPELQGRGSFIRVSYYFVKSSRLIFSWRKNPRREKLGRTKVPPGNFWGCSNPCLSPIA